ncbi:hypothetical protein AAFF_G00106120 [Aldrovandia affinis]|uniref:Uncharacterized protein n=1 Tax=Aldrovandia affinis TaxID=143900 RepID=A0AAD7T284_9TELE|nr:hypothetical protein AAFF_G00106120 [Aldrovandia affinis]
MPKVSERAPVLAQPVLSSSAMVRHFSFSPWAPAWAGRQGGRGGVPVRVECGKINILLRLGRCIHGALYIDKNTRKAVSLSHYIN